MSKRNGKRTESSAVEETVAIDAHPVETETRNAAAIQVAAEPELTTRPEPPSYLPRKVVITITEKMALGNGDRPAGTELAEIVLRPGIEIGEVVTAFCNPNRFSVRVG